MIVLTQPLSEVTQQALAVLMKEIFDDQTQDRTTQETAAVLVILPRLIDGVDRLAWSAILTFENAQHPLADRRTDIAQWAQRRWSMSPSCPKWRHGRTSQLRRDFAP